MEIQIAIYHKSIWSFNQDPLHHRQIIYQHPKLFVKAVISGQIRVLKLSLALHLGLGHQFQIAFVFLSCSYLIVHFVASFILIFSLKNIRFQRNTVKFLLVFMVKWNVLNCNYFKNGKMICFWTAFRTDIDFNSRKIKVGKLEKSS